MIVPDVTRLSPNVNHYDMPDTCKTVIIHCTRSGHSMNPTEFDGTLGYMMTPGTVSSHWVVSRTGVKARVVPDFRQAWHAGVDNDNAWGIEIEQGVEDDGFTDDQLAAVVAICKSYRDEHGVPPRHATTSTEGGFIGHEETEQGKSVGKSDPGHLFPWEWFIEQLQPAALTPIGIGVHYTDGFTEEVWNAGGPEAGYRTLDGIGVSYADGRTEQIWP